MLINKTQQYIIGYSSISIALLSWSIYDSLRKSFNFVMFLVEFTDGIKLGIIVNFIIFLFLIIDKSLQILLFGSLRMIEVEHLFEKLPIFVINLLLNLATGDNNIIMNVFLMGLSMSFKVFHVIMFDRLDYVNLIIVNKINDEDIYLNQVIYHFVYDVFQGINSVTCLLFGFQFAVQGVQALTYFSKLLLGIYEIAFYRIRKNEHHTSLRGWQESTTTSANLEETERTTNNNDNESGNCHDEDDDIELIWDNKPYYTKGIDIASAVLTSISYLSFVYLLTIHSGLSLPLSMLQGTYSSMRRAWVETNQLLAFIESSKRLDTQLANASAEDLSQSDSLCIICREDMHSVEDYQRIFKKPQSPRRSPKKLKCGHILHLGCLKEWLERSDSCPLCRRKVFSNDGATNATNNNNNNNGENNQNNGNVPPPQPGDVPVPPPAPTATATAAAVNAELQREVREINDLLQNAENTIAPQEQPINTAAEPIEGPSRTIPLPSSSSTLPIPQSNDLSQSITLPKNALLPPGWLVIPLKKPEQENSDIDYKVNISSYHQADLKINNKKPSTRDIITYAIPKEESIGEYEM
ncbi:Ring finger domain family protein [Candida albicans]|uniref:RING-type E3 ubiquitin transferase n=1 Tax=Candida albicans TaxID=5476 RepID=A0A8H6BW10_CANAX|nr:Ring finger domain family protein [Candida albicans]